MMHDNAASAGAAVNPKRFIGAKPHTHQGNLWHLHRTIVKRLAPLPNWVNWKWELNENGDAWTKVPYQPRTPTAKAATNDKKTWGTYTDAVVNVEAGRADGIGFCLLDTNICAFDVDDCRDPLTGKIDPVALDLIKRCGATYAEETVSGRGLRIIGLGGTKYVNRKQKINGSKVSIESYRNCSRYITVSGMTLAGVKPNLPDLGNIDGVMTDIVAELDRGSGAAADSNTTDRDAPLGDDVEAGGDINGDINLFREAALPPDLLELVRDGVPIGERSEQFFHAVQWMKHLGWSLSDIVALLNTYREGIASKYAAGNRVAAEARRAYGKPGNATLDNSSTQQAQASASPDSLTMADFYAYMPRHQYIFVPTGEMWPAASVNARLPKAPVLKRDGTPAKDKNGNFRREPPSRWLDKHRPVEQMTWVPGAPQVVPDKLIAEGGWFDRPGAMTFNLYRPPAVRLGNSAGADRWVELVHRIYPGDAEHIVAYCAHRVQHPAVKINHGVMLGGSPGIGKDTMLEPLKHGVGPWNFKEVSPQDIMGGYNDFIRCVVLRVSEAHDLGDVNRYAFYDHMKTILATPPDVVRVNGKYIPQHYVTNVAGVFYTTNHRFDGVYLPADDRRTYVAWSELTSSDFAGGFWTSFWGWYMAGGLENVVAYLAEYDLSNFDPKAPPKKTDAFWQIVSAGAAPEVSELADLLDVLGLQEGAKDADGNPCGPVVTTLARVTKAAQGGLYEWLSDRKNRRVIPHRFERCGYTPVRNDDAKDGYWVIDGKRQPVFGRVDVPLSERIKAARKLA